MPPPRDKPNPVEGPGDYTTTSTVHSDTYPGISPLNSDLTGKAVLISGASKGIGRCMTLSFARAGASYIAIGARSDLSTLVQDIKTAAREAKRKEPHVLAIPLDVADQKSVESCAKSIGKEFPKLDIIINNAGVFAGAAPIADSDPELWWQNWEINVRGPYLVARSFIPFMLEKGGDKTIITVASVGAHLKGPGLSGYQTSKFAQLRLMEFVCAEYGDKGILAYSIHPGNVPGTEILPGGIPEHLKHVFCETTDLSADTLTFLTREKRNWLAGRYVNCTWDMPELMAKEEEIVKKDMLKVKLVV